MRCDFLHLWSDNLEFEFELISNIIDFYPFISWTQSRRRRWRTPCASVAGRGVPPLPTTVCSRETKDTVAKCEKWGQYWWDKSVVKEAVKVGKEREAEPKPVLSAIRSPRPQQTAVEWWSEGHYEWDASKKERGGIRPQPISLFANFLFREMRRIRPQPSPAVFNKLLTTVVNLEHYTVALSMFDEMRQSGQPVNSYTFSIIMHCYCLLNRVDLGFAVMGTFLKLGYELDGAIFTTLMKGLFLDNRAIEAEKLFQKMLDDNLCECSEDMISYFIYGLCQAGHHSIACDYLELMAKTGCDANVCGYSIVIDSLCKGGMVEDALQLLRDMTGMGILPNAVTYSSMIHGLCGVGRWDDMRDLLHRVIDEKISLRVFTFNALLNVICKKSKLNEFEDLLEIMMQQNVRPDYITYNTLLHGYCLQGKMEKAKELFDSLPDKGIEPNVYSYGFLINGYCKNGNVNEAWHIFLEVRGKGLKCTTCTYTILIQGLLREGRFVDGWKVFSDMEAQGVCPDLFTYNILLDGLCKARLTDDAISLVRKMEERGVNPDANTYDILIGGLCDDGRLDLARDFVAQLPVKGLKPTARISRMVSGSPSEKRVVKEACSNSL